MLGNFIVETVNNPGVATLNLLGAATGRVTFSSIFSSGSQCYYYISNGTSFEYGIGTSTTGAPNTLSRDTVFGNSSGTTTKINFSGLCTVWNDVPAQVRIGYGTRSRIDPTSGYLGLGLTAPSSRLHVSGDASASADNVRLRLTDTGASGRSITLGTSAGVTTLRDLTGAVDFLSISAAGLVSAPGGLTTDGNVQAGQVIVGTAGTASQVQLYLENTSRSTMFYLSASTGVVGLWDNSGSINRWYTDTSGNLSVYGTVTTPNVSTVNLTASGTSSFNYATFTGAIGGSTSGWGYGYTGGGSYSGAYAVSAYFAYGLLSSQNLIVASDRRVKTDIIEISRDEGRRFVAMSRPVSFIKNGFPGTGFIAQEQLKAGYGVIRFPFPGMQETIDDDGFISPKDEQMGLCMEDRIAYLVAALKDVYDQLDALRARLPPL